MNILFLTLAEINSIDQRGIYTDLLRKFVNEGHHVSIVSPKERRKGIQTNIVLSDKVDILQVKTLNIVSTNIIEKGIGTLAIEYQFLSGIRKYLSDVQFDLILYSTPPITFTKVVEAIKKRDGAMSYLLLKDIFPQNAVDLGMIKENGLIHRFFRRKEKQMYRISDFIGCMSPANVAYVLKHNPQIPERIVEVCPNSIEPDINETFVEKSNIRDKYKIPAKATLFIYGGNLGKPQGLDFLLEVLESNNNKEDRFFIVIGKGTEQRKIANWFSNYNPANAIYLDSLPKVEYDQLVKSCDVGLIFLDKRFTIPNFPSRLLSYLEYKMPVLLATDENSDMGKIAVENNFGFYSVHGDIQKFNDNLEKIISNQAMIKEMGESGYTYLKNNYTVEHSYQIIIKHFS